MAVSIKDPADLPPLPPSSDSSLQARRLAANGYTVGDSIELLPADAERSNPVVASAPGGDLFVVWQEMTTTDWDIRGQRFRADGSAVADAFTVSSVATGDQRNPEIAALPTGEAIVVWESEGGPGEDTDGSSIHAQQLLLWLFRDGFESGDFNAWSMSP